MRNRMKSLHVVATVVLATGGWSVVEAGDNSGQSTADWSYLGGNPEQWGYSTATQINQSTVASMGLLWYSDLPLADGLVGNPQVRGGIVYQSAPKGVVVANDIATGRILWTFEPTLELSKASLTALYGVNKNRGLAVDEKHVYGTSGDCHVFALDRLTGKQIWNSLSCDPSRDYGIVGAPRIGAGEVFVGNNNHELGTERGFEDAFDTATGNHLWRFYTVPGDPSHPPESRAMEMASKTWKGNWWKYTRGGATPWDSAIYDPKTGLLIFGAGDPNLGSRVEPGWMRPEGSDPDSDTRKTAPLSQDDGRAAALADGDWLFAASIIAVNAKTGEYAWHFQLVPHDRYGNDVASGFIIADLPIKGRTRHVLMQAAKNGHFYVLDAQSGTCISANNYVPVTTYYPIDQKTCKLTPREEAKSWLHPNNGYVRQPGGYGAHSWQQAAYNPITHLVYIPAFISDSAGSNKVPEFRTRGMLIAWDPIAQKERWHVDYPIMMSGGVLSTAGNLVLQGTPDGKFLAYAADSGKQLWSYDTKSVILGQPTTVISNGKQIILVPAGDGGAAVVATANPNYASTTKTQAPSRLLAFGLGGTATLPDTPPKVLLAPARPPQPEELAAQGAKLYAANSCSLCHGPGAINGGGHIPDLRNIREGTLELMPLILKEGALRQGGMPQFRFFSDADVKALQAYVINQAWAGYKAQQSGTATTDVETE
jgi:PQQ-dependent dehydrogenase (methanol/ethanol family)